MYTINNKMLYLETIKVTGLKAERIKKERRYIIFKLYKKKYEDYKYR